MATKICYTVKEASEVIGISDKSVRRLLHDGKIRSFRYGPIWLIPVETLSEDVVRLTRAGVNAKGGGYRENNGGNG